MTMKVNPKLLIVIRGAGLGEGDVDLCEKLMRNFLKSLISSGEAPARMIFMGTGIFLTTEDSPVIQELKELESAGTRIASCLTCLDYYRRSDKLLIGIAGNMRDAVEAMLSFEKVIQL